MHLYLYTVKNKLEEGRRASSKGRDRIAKLVRHRGNEGIKKGLTFNSLN
jgi:hypothetical protein